MTYFCWIFFRFYILMETFQIHFFFFSIRQLKRPYNQSFAFHCIELKCRSRILIFRLKFFLTLSDYFECCVKVIKLLLLFKCRLSVTSIDLKFNFENVIWFLDFIKLQIYFPKELNFFVSLSRLNFWLMNLWIHRSEFDAFQEKKFISFVEYWFSKAI